VDLMHILMFSSFLSPLSFFLSFFLSKGEGGRVTAGEAFISLF